MIVANALRLPYADASAHMAATSPPYYQKRRYAGVEPMEWPAVSYSPMPGLPPVKVPKVTAEQIAETPEQVAYRELRDALRDDARMGSRRYAEALAAWLLLLGLLGSPLRIQLEEPPLTPGQLAGILGLEPDVFAYIGHLVLVFRETWRVLRDDGILCVNIGDTYCGGRSGPQGKTGQRSDRRFTAEGLGQGAAAGYKRKDLMGIPWRLAFALIADGWTLRSRMPGGVEMRPDVIWSKNAMPESVRDRPSVDFEDVLIFSKSRRYCWDQMNAKISAVTDDRPRSCWADRDEPQRRGDPGESGHVTRTATLASANRANLRTSWRINTEPTKEKHYAAWPRELARRLIRIGTSDKGCCPECGAQWVREKTQRLPVTTSAAIGGDPARQDGGTRERDPTGAGGNQLARRWVAGSTWAPSCSCHGPGLKNGWPPIPCRVLDPFSGIGRTGEVCYETGRTYMPAELSIGYAEIQRRRLEEKRPQLEVERERLEAAAAGEVLGRGKVGGFDGPLFGGEA